MWSTRQGDETVYSGGQLVKDEGYKRRNSQTCEQDVREQMNQFFCKLVQVVHGENGKIKLPACEVRKQRSRLHDAEVRFTFRQTF